MSTLIIIFELGRLGGGFAELIKIGVFVINRDFITIIETFRDTYLH
jgi:hypothetical protein